MQTRAGPDAIVGSCTTINPPTCRPIQEAAHLREVADEGESAATPAILAGATLAFVATLATTVFLPVFTVAHFA